MFLRSTIIAAFAVALVTAGSAFAGSKDELVIKGKVIGDDGKPQPEAEIRVRRLDVNEKEQFAVTDSKGQYIIIGLHVGNYSVTAYDPNGFARSRAIIKPDRTGWAKVDFDLGKDKSEGDSAAGRPDGHEHFTQPNSHGGAISARQ